MEKLQKALNKARQERDGASVQAAQQVAPATTPKPDLPQVKRGQNVVQSAPPKAFPPIWDQLTPFEPNPDILLKNRVMTLNAQAVPNPFDILGTKVLLLMRQNNWTRLAITSPTKGCGKTTLACNLATGLSRQRETCSMLFDVDLRRPGTAKLFGARPEHGIKSMLAGDVSPTDQLLRLRTNVALSMARNAVSDPAQLLLSKATSAKFDRLQSDFEPDMMIFDLPPMLVTEDARAFLKNVDCCLIVARAEETKISQLDICEREVGEQTNVLGVVLNDCRNISEEEQYYGEYR